MHTPTQTVGANSRAEVARRGLTQAALAEVIGVSQSQLSKRLRGVIPFDVNEVAAIANALDVPITELVTAKAGSAA
ncbi:MAG: helix-turn-helix transcriptional regulator [Propionibacteriaceae bacterium]|nr:helix-turn-helix transcriptional regulator [Propionibacteriaceae bacterium]